MREPDMSKPHKGTFTNWSIHYGIGDGGLGFALVGVFHGHPVFSRKPGHTSEVFAIFPELNMIETRNSRYTLERPSICESKELMQYVKQEQ